MFVRVGGNRGWKCKIIRGISTTAINELREPQVNQQLLSAASADSRPRSFGSGTAVVNLRDFRPSRLVSKRTWTDYT